MVNNKFDIVLADPPWTYRDKAQSGQRGVGFKYDTMTMKDIAALPVKKIVTNDALLFLWVAWPQMEAIFKHCIFESWGFKYKTCAFNWVKKNKKKDSFFKGMGHYTRSNSECVLLGTRGRGASLITNHAISQIVVAPRRGHSQKPNEIYGLIENLCQKNARKLELFARERRPGWSAWGNEVPGGSDEIFPQNS